MMTNNVHLQSEFTHVYKLLTFLMDLQMLCQLEYM